MRPLFLAISLFSSFTTLATTSQPPAPSHLRPSNSSPTLTPSPALIPPASPHNIEARCTSEGNCGGGTATTLQASTVTSTILSTTSVPCYITTITTSSTTYTSTIYSTETITSTETKEGTVYVIQYSPTPVVMSTLVESTIEVTESWWSYWLESSGSYGTSTSQGETSTVDSGCDACEAAQESVWDSGGSTSSGNADNSEISTIMTESADTGTVDSDSDSAWTHVSNNNDAAGVSSTATSADGWGSSLSRTGNTDSTSVIGSVNWSGARAKGIGGVAWGVVGTAIVLRMFESF